MSVNAEARAGASGVAPALALRAVRKTYRGGRGAGARTAVDGVSLSIEPGAWVALLGPNGAGKSTLMRMIATLDRASEGEIVVLGADTVREPARARAGLGVVFQSPGLDPLLTVRENLMCQASLFGLRGAGAEARAERAAADLGVADRMDDRVGSLSGGLARRVDLARSLLASPRLLLLDEPTTGLDHDARSAFLRALSERIAAARSAGAPMTALMSTHLMDEAERADRVVMLSRGTLVAEGSPAALRAGMGGACIRCDPGEEAESILLAAGLRPERRGAVVIAPGDVTASERAAGALARAGLAFTYGPPTLGDVYLGITGESLAEAEGSTDANSPARRRRTRERAR